MPDARDTLMTWTLWRGETLLGALHERSVPEDQHPTRKKVRLVHTVLVPEPAQLRVRDETGRVVPTRSVSVLEHRPHPEHLPAELSTFPEGAYVSGSVWLVFFTRDVDAPAT